MGAPSLPPLQFFPGCGHLFFPSVLDMGHSPFNGELGHLGRLNPLAPISEMLAPLEQLGQLGSLGHLTAPQLRINRTTPNSLSQNECGSSIGSLNAPSSSSSGDFASGSSDQFRSGGHSRPRGEKRPIPEEHKDDKYYERRRRNNQAAKKSRDARKKREDQIAVRAAILERENRVLHHELLKLREEKRNLCSYIINRVSGVNGSTVSGRLSNN